MVSVIFSWAAAQADTSRDTRKNKVKKLDSWSQKPASIWGGFFFFLIFLSLIHILPRGENIKAAHGFVWTKGKDEVFHLTLTGFTVAFV